jgi:hypothetical protein
VCRNVRTKRTKRTNSRRDGSVVRKMCAISAIRGCLRILFLSWGSGTVQSTYEPPPRHVAPSNVRRKRNKRKKPPSYVRACRFSLGRGGFATNSRHGRTLLYGRNSFLPVTSGTICLLMRYVSAIVLFVTRRRLSPGLVGPGLSGRVAFPKLSKLLNQEDALSAPCYPVLPRRALAGRAHAADKR